MAAVVVDGGEFVVEHKRNSWSSRCLAVFLFNVSDAGLVLLEAGSGFSSTFSSSQANIFVFSPTSPAIQSRYLRMYPSSQKSNERSALAPLSSFSSFYFFTYNGFYSTATEHPRPIHLFTGTPFFYYTHESTFLIPCSW